MGNRLVVIGGDAAGMSAASQARKRRGAEDLEIVAFERGHHTSYSACGIPYWVGDVVPALERLVTRSPETFRTNYEIGAFIRHEVEEIDLTDRVVKVRDLDGGRTKVESFDELVIATGATPVRPDLPGSRADGIYGVQTLDDGVAIRKALAFGDIRRAVVVGGGYIGIEMAEALVNRGIEVTLVERAAQPMSTLDADMGALVAEAMTGLGITVVTGQSVQEFNAIGGKVSGVVTEEGQIPADIVILGLGVRPNSKLAADAGIPVGPTGGIITDLRQHTSVEGVWAAGDCTETYHRVSRRPVAIALGTHANKQGRVAGVNIGGGYATFPGVVGTAVSKVCSLEVARTGLSERECVAAGFAFETATVESTTRAGYYPGAAPITTKVVAEARSGRLLGAQIVGREGAAKRIDVFATALWNEMTVEEVLSLDLSYAPPFAPVWDPVLIAARKAWEQVEDTAARYG